MELRGEGVYLGGRLGDASERFEASWFVNLADKDGETLQVMAPSADFPATYEWPASLTPIEFVLNVRERKAGGKSATLVALTWKGAPAKAGT